MSFELIKSCTYSFARRGRLQLGHGSVETPVFMPVGTHGAVRGLSSWEMEETGAEIMLANNYHLTRRPGLEVIQGQGGLHKFMSWPRNLLTDSGGFQVFSLAKNRKLSDEGVEFRDPIDGRKLFLSPESVVHSQESWGSDIMMVLDQCPPAGAPASEQREALRRTQLWAEKSLAAWKVEKSKLFPIVQGGCDTSLRQESLAGLLALEEKLGRKWPGMAVGGLSVGETKERFVQTLYGIREFLPEDRPRYLMGVGTPRDLVFGVACGIDMFDCVIPSRNARHGIVMTSGGRLNLFNQAYETDEAPLDRNCRCRVCDRYTRSFLRHLFMIEEPLGPQLATIHNIFYFLDLFRQIREHIENESFDEFARDFLQDPKNIYLGKEAEFTDFPQTYR